MITTAPALASTSTPAGSGAVPVVAHAAQAYLALVRARRQVQALQRAAVLGAGDGDALDAAVFAFRRARNEAARFMMSDDSGESPAEERFARWLLEAVRRTPATI